MKHCGDCDYAVFDEVDKAWICAQTGKTLMYASLANWPSTRRDKSNLDELECYLESDEDER